MSNLLKYAYDVKLVAQELEFEAAGKKMPVEETASEKMQEYSKFIKNFFAKKRKWVPVFEGIVDILASKINKNLSYDDLIGDIQTKITEMKKKEKLDKVSPTEEIQSEKAEKQYKGPTLSTPRNIINFLKRYETRFKSDENQTIKNYNRHPAFKILESMLDYGIQNGLTSMITKFFIKNQGFRLQERKPKQRQLDRQEV